MKMLTLHHGCISGYTIASELFCLYFG